MPLISTRWLDRAAPGLITEANNRTGKVGSAPADHIPTGSQGREQDPYRDFHLGKVIATKPPCSQPATASPIASPASSQGCSSPRAHTGLWIWALLANTPTSWGVHSQGFTSHSPGVRLSWSCWSWRGHYKSSAPSLCPKAECHMPRPFPKDASNLD